MQSCTVLWRGRCAPFEVAGISVPIPLRGVREFAASPNSKSQVSLVSSGSEGECQIQTQPLFVQHCLIHYFRQKAYPLTRIHLDAGELAPAPPGPSAGPHAERRLQPVMRRRHVRYGRACRWVAAPAEVGMAPEGPTRTQPSGTRPTAIQRRTVAQQRAARSRP